MRAAWMMVALWTLGCGGMNQTAWPDLAQAPRSAALEGANDAALIVAIEDYAHVPDVTGARRNAADWRAWLRARGVRNVKVLQDAEAWHSFGPGGQPLGILSELEATAARVKPGGTLWFVFIGHGAPNGDPNAPDGLLLAHTVQQTAMGLRAGGIPVEGSLLTRLRPRAEGARTVAVLDACFSGRDTTGQAVVPGLQPVFVAGPSAVPAGVTLLSAARGDQFAGPLPGLARPAFSYLALGALRGWADEDSDGSVTGDEVRVFVEDVLFKFVTGRTQTPEARGEVAAALSSAMERAPALLVGETVASAPQPTVEAPAAAPPAVTPTPVVTPTPEPTPATAPPNRAGIEWVRIEGGSFRMGSESGYDDEKPVRTVRVGSLALSKTEVTVRQYRACVEAGACTAPDTRTYCNWDKSGRDDHPINCVDWEQASAFAKWAGGRLPSEAEWEYAARSRGKVREYAWGNQKADCSRAVMSDGSGDGCGADSTAPVCSKPGGNTAQGLCDMAGNVWEWVEDWYGPYGEAPRDGSARTKPARYRVLRGGGWSLTASNLRAARRFRSSPGRRFNDLGFRVARATP